MHVHRSALFSGLSAMFLLLALAPSPGVAIVEDILDVLKLSKEVTSSLLETWDLIEQTHAVNEVDIPFYKVKEKKILTRMSQLQRKIDNAESEVRGNAIRYEISDLIIGLSLQSSSRVTWTIDKINEDMITNTQLQLQLRELNRDLNRVFSQQNLMRAYAQHEHQLEKTTLLTYAEMVVSPGETSIQSLLERIHLLVTGSSDLKTLGSRGLLELIADNLKVGNYM